MAVIDGIDGIEVTITVDGNDLKEYDEDDSEDETGTVTKYVEATTGKEFAVRYMISNKATFKGNAMRLSVTADSNPIAGHIIGRAIVRKNTSVEQVVDHKMVDKRHARKLVFGELSIGTHNEVEKSTQIQGTGLGEILVQLWHIRKGRRVARKVKTEKTRNLCLSEKDIKGQSLSHGTSFGDRFKAPPSRTFCSTQIAGQTLPIATFKFRYRSLKSLKDMMIIPRTPSPVPLSERPVDGLTVEELRQLVKEQKDKIAAQPVLKRENETGMVKEEPIREGEGRRSGARKRARIQKGIEVLEIHDDGRISSRVTTEDLGGAKAESEVIEVADD